MRTWTRISTTVAYLGAAAPYGAGILAACTLELPPGAVRAIGQASVWSPTTENVAFGASVYLAVVKTGGAVADIRLFQLSPGASIPLAPVVVGESYLFRPVAFAAALAYTQPFCVSFEVG